MRRYPIGTKLNNSQHKGAESATPVTLDIRISLWLTDKRAAVALTPPSIVLSFPDVRLNLKLSNCIGDRNARLHCLQLIPPLQPTVGIDGNLQQIVHLPFN
jgi:hypothetical protein